MGASLKTVVGSSQCRSDDEHSELEVIWIRDEIVKFADSGPEPSGDVVESACVRLSLSDRSSAAYMIDRLLAGTLQEYRLGTVVGVIIYDDLRRFLGAARCRWRKGHGESAASARP